MNKKILILYTSVGLGHKYIALNIAYHLEQAGFTVKLADVLQVQSGPMVKIGEWLHSLINRRFPFIWRWLYMSKAFSKLTMPLRVPLAGRNCENVKQVISEFQPDMIISTQTSGSAPVAYLKQVGFYKGKFVIAFSDYHFHPYWWYESADFYLVNIEEQKAELLKLGVKPEQVVVCGITLKPYIETNIAAVKQKLGLTDKKVVLMASGSLGIGFPTSLLYEYAQKLKHKQPDAKLVVVTGKNEAMKQSIDIESSKRGLGILTLGFYEPFAELLAISDVFLTKPGGLTVAEALRDDVKMVATHFLPGQEELNYEYLIQRRLMFPIPDPRTADNLVEITAVILARSERVENPNSAAITQKNHEGTELIKSIKNLFHNV